MGYSNQAHAILHGPGKADQLIYNYGDNISGLIEPFPGAFATGAGTMTTQIPYIVCFTPDQGPAAAPTKLYAVFDVVAAFTSSTYFAVALCSVDATGALTAILAQTGDVHATSLDVFTAPNTKTAAQVITAATGVYAVPLSKDAAGSALGTLPTPVRGTRYAFMAMSAGNSAGQIRAFLAASVINHWWISQALGQSSPGTISGALPLKAKVMGAQATNVLPGTTGGNALPVGAGGSGASMIPWVALLYA
jgi:hypothetical protein